MKGLIVLLLVLLWAPLAIGAPDTEQDAEIIRLREILSSHYRNERWAGVDKFYLKMLENDKRESILTADDHVIGAMASSSVGNIEETIGRLERALFVEDRPTIVQWMETLLQHSCEVSLSAKNGEILVHSEGLFEPEMIEAVDFVNEQLFAQGSFKGRIPLGLYSLGEKELSITIDGISEVEQEVLRKDPVVIEEQSPIVIEEKFPVDRIDYGFQDSVTLSPTIMLWSSTQNGHDGPLPFAAGGFSLGWERRLLKGNFLYGFQPQISFIGHSKGGVLGLLPHAFVGVRGQSLSWTIGIVQQTYFIAQRGFSSRTGEDCAQCFDSGFSYGWGAQSRLVWMRKETAGIFAQSTFGGDGLRTMNLINVGYIRDY